MLEIILVGIILGFVLWLVTKYIPMSPPFPTVVVVVVAVLYVLWAFQNLRLPAIL